MPRLYASKRGPSNRPPNHPKGFTPPVKLPTYTVAAVARLLPRLRCGACRGRLRVEAPVFPTLGRLHCPDCGRQYAEVVGKLPKPITAFREDDPPKRGRPPCSCGLCSTCRMRAYRARLKAEVAS